MTKKPVMRRPRIWKRDVPLQGFIDWLARESFKPGDACEMTITCKDAQYCVMDCRAVQQGANVAPACVHCGAPAGFRHDWMCKTRDAERSSVQSAAEDDPFAPELLCDCVPNEADRQPCRCGAKRRADPKSQDKPDAD